MRNLPLNQLQPGMLTATHVYSSRGQLLIEAQTILTTQNIAHLAYYNVEEVQVYTENEMTPTLLHEVEDRASEPPTYSQRVKESPEFQEFQAEYTSNVSLVTDAINDIIESSAQVDQTQLLSEVNTLFQENRTTLSLFDMLHNMREIDDSTYAHSYNVSIIARMIGQWLNYSEEDLDTLTLCGLLHDIGKCMVDQAIITKPARLTDAEYAAVKKHPQLGYDILKYQDVNQHVRNAALMHHERCDGTGYPLKLTTPQIDPFAQIIAIADVYDAMTANRCYRQGLCPFEVIATFENEGLEKYNPHFILTFLEHIADTYMNNDVLLSDGSHGTIALINRQRMSRPIIHLRDGSFVNLLERRDLFISKLL